VQFFSLRPIPIWAMRALLVKWSQQNNKHVWLVQMNNA
jgi:hypothetical protein